MAATEDSTSSSDKKNKTTDPTIIDENEDEELQQKPTDGKLAVHHLESFGFNLAEEAKRDPGKWDGGGGAGGGDLTKAIAAAKKGRSKNKNQTVVYGADPDDVGDTDFNDDDDDQDYPVIDDDSNEDDEEEDQEYDDEEDEHEDQEEGSEIPGHSYLNLEDYYDEADDMWEDEEDEDEEDEEELERQRQEAYESALLAAEEERERIRDLRLAEIMKKKEILIERYLRVARVMINHRKKNIYLQDYLYHLALRKGVLRGDNQMSGTSMDSEESDTALNKAMRKKVQKKNSMMAARFARFLRKTGHLYDEEKEKHDHHHHHQHHHHHHHHQVHHHPHHLNAKSRTNFNDHRSRHQNVHNHHHHHHHHRPNLVPRTLVRKNIKTCPEAEEGKECPLNKKTIAKVKLLSKGRPHNSPRSVKSSGGSSRSVGQTNKPRTLAELLEQKAAVTLHRLMKTANDALDAFERHRCRMAKRKQLIRIATLLERQYSGMSLLEQERNHLVSFVEQSVKAQSLAKKKALRRQQKNKTQNKTGVVNLNHQWTKSLERIRELRLKKAKLEQEHRLVLLKKVKHWHIWEKRDLAAMQALGDFVTDMGNKANMSKGESLSFRHSLNQFHKQLHHLHNAMLEQVIKMFKAQNALGMAQRHAKDNTSVAAPVKGFSISDYERMIIENQESHSKLVERQAHLMEQYEKLKKYIKRVAESHLKKQRSWGALRTGRHDMKQLWELCINERDSLLKKLKEIRFVKRIHQRLFMQISVLENKRIFKDFQKITLNVKELMDQERDLQTQLHQAHSLLRILNVKCEDTEIRNAEKAKENAEKAIKQNMEFSRETIQRRINPKVPNTIYDVNIRSRKSQKNFFENERQTPNTGTSTPIKSAMRTKIKLPPIKNQ